MRVVYGLITNAQFSIGSIVMKAIKKRIITFLEREEYDKALDVIACQNRLTSEIKILEVHIYYTIKMFPIAIEKGEKYLKQIKNKFIKANLAGYLYLIYRAIGKFDKEKEYRRLVIEIYKSIIEDSNSKIAEINLARLNLIAELRMVGDLKRSLKEAKKLEMDLEKGKSDCRSLAPVYKELSDIYKSLAIEVSKATVKK